MAERKVWIGSIGPFLYDDEDIITDENGNVIGSQKALFTDGEVHGTVSGSKISDGNSIGLSYTPSNYTTNDQKLSTHLEGIDNKLGEDSNKLSNHKTRISNNEQQLADHESRISDIEQQMANTWSGTFQTGDGKTATVQNGLITDVS